MKISIFKSAMAKNCVTLESDLFFDQIKNGKWKFEIGALRDILLSHGKTKYNIKKKTLNAVTLSGYFNGRKDLVEYSGLLQGDIDECSAPKMLRDKLSLDPHVRASFLSPSGNGVKLAIRVSDDPEMHLQCFLHAQEYFKEKYDVNLDIACKDINRLLFVSYDEELKGNEDCVQLLPPESPQVEIELDEPVVETVVEGGPRIETEPFFDATLVFDDPTKTDYEKAEAALRNTSPEEYDTWFKVACSLKSLLGESGFTLWDSWSSQSPKYNAQEMRYKWNSFSQDGGITGGTLLQNFDFAPPEMVPRPKTETPKEEQEEPLRLLPTDLCYPQGFVGDMVQFICENSRYPQPILALAATLSFTATLLGRKVCTEDDIRPNLYTIGIGKTGIGKEAARSVIKKMFAENEIPGFGAEKVTSRTAIERVISQTPSALFLFDEFGKYAQAILSERSPNHIRDVMTCIMELYTSSSSMFYGQDRASLKDVPRFQISQPHPNIYGTTTAETLWEGLTHAAIRDGSLNRFLIFCAPDERPQRQSAARLKKIPPRFKMAILRMTNLSENVRISSLPNEGPYDPTKFLDHLGDIMTENSVYRQVLDRNFGEVMNDPDPMVITYSEDALKIFDDFEDETLIKADKDTSTASMWVRASEHAKKIALILAASRFMPQITTEIANYSTQVVSFIQRKAVHEIVLHLADNYVERESKRVEQIIRERKGGITLAELTKQTRFLKNRSARKNIIEDLYEAEILNVESRENCHNKMTAYYIIED